MKSLNSSPRNSRPRDLAATASSTKKPLTRRASDIGPNSPRSPVSPRSRTPSSAASPGTSGPSEYASLLELLKQQQESLRLLQIDQATVLGQQMVMAQNMALLNKNMVFMNGNVTALRERIEDMLNESGGSMPLVDPTTVEVEVEVTDDNVPPPPPPNEDGDGDWEVASTPVIDKLPDMAVEVLNGQVVEDKVPSKQVVEDTPEAVPPEQKFEEEKPKPTLEEGAKSTNKAPDATLSPDYNHYAMTDDNGGAKSEKPTLSSDEPPKAPDATLSPDYNHYTMTDDNGGAKSEKPTLSSESSASVPSEETSSANKNESEELKEEPKEAKIATPESEPVSM